MLHSFCALTDAGRLRPNNEDAVCVDEASRLIVLADGMGGHQAGEVASRMAVSLIAAELGPWLSGPGRQATAAEAMGALRDCVDRVNQAILQAAASRAEYAGMGTTVVFGAFHGSQLLLGHVGDSRAYCWRQGRLERLTTDHTLLQRQLDAGLLTPAQAARSAGRFLLTRALGVEARVVLALRALAVEPGDLYLLCSDGLTDMLDDERLAGLLAQGGGLQAQAQRLVDGANAEGGRDNVSVVLAQLSAPA
nr:PP2C family serine/threonine-protein phosphatase [Ramlibacter sp. 2FC]